MKENRALALSYILEDEGPELNIGGSEPGGASKFGISVNFLTDYRKKHFQPIASITDVAMLTSDIASKIYAETLLDPLRFDELPSGVDYRLADIATNLGLTGGPTLLQVTLGMWPITGTIDNATITAVSEADQKQLVFALGAAWLATKRCSTNWSASPITKNGYGHGWTNRANRARDRALAMVKS